MDKQEKDKLYGYGKLLWDFVNGKTPDDILISCFENLQSSFNYSKDFPEKALTYFPTEKMTMDKLTDKEKKLFKILLERNKNFDYCNYVLTNHSHLTERLFCINKYESMDCGLKISTTDLRKKTSAFQPYPDKTFLVSEELIEDFIYLSAVIEKDKAEDLKSDLKTLINLCNKIEEIKSETTNRFTFIEKMAEDYPKVSELQNCVIDAQKNLKHILLQIIETDNAYEIIGLKLIWSSKNGHPVKLLLPT